VAQSLAVPDSTRATSTPAVGAPVPPRARASDVAAAGGAIRTALSLVLAPLADAADDAKHPLDPQQRSRIELARRAAASLQSLVEGLLEQSSSPRVPVAVAPLDLSAATRHLAAMFRPALASAPLTVDCAPLPHPALVDRRMWETAVVALLNRALRSGPGPVAVRVSESAGAALLEVGAPTASEDGAALAIARQFAAGHGGTFVVDTDAGGRWTARITIPLSAAHPPPAAASAPSPSPTSRTDARILVVSEDPDLRDYMSSLVGARWLAETSPDASAALAAARERVPDLFLIDGDARSLDTRALARALRADPRTKRVPMLMVAAAAAQEGEEEAGPDEYVGKPFASRDLVSRIASHLELARVRDEATRREQKARLDAEAANRAKDEFIAMISHELRTPLGAILIWAQLLRTEELDAAATARAVGMIERSTKTLAQLIDDLLDVSRIIAGKLTFEARPVDLRSVVEAALDAAQLAAESRGVTVERLVEPGVPTISGDAGRLQQVVGNLIANAIKFTPEGGRIRVTLERVATHARIRVADTGVGINPDFLPFIFERFRQADTTSTRKQKGLGLGLAIARHIVEMHGGSIEAESRGEGEGSTFTVTLPLAAREEAAVPDTPPAEERADAATLAGVRILVVDDEEDAREAMVVLLSQAGALVRSVGSATEALAALREHPPDLLLSDIAMPGEDGYSLIRRVRALADDHGGQVPAAALTAYATLDDRRKALQAGYNDHIPKPVDPARLIATVAELIDRG
jgi:signal transduction histidine kinase/ActR/RegA family two-component response regulator